MNETSKHHKIVVVGGGTAGITVAACLCRALKDPDIAIIEPSEEHHYQPLWTLVGAGVGTREATTRSMASVIPPKATWLKDAVTAFDPEQNRVACAERGWIGYDWLIVAPGLQLNWDGVKGLPEAIGKDGVCSNYGHHTVKSTWQFLQAVQEGNALFTHPNTPIKCGGAPQKIMYLAEEHFRRRKVRDKVNIMFSVPSPKLFAVPVYNDRLEQICTERNIEVRTKSHLIEVRGEQREAVFENLDDKSTFTKSYSMLHVTPPMGAPDFVKKSPLADAGGWVDVDKHSLRHTKYENVFSLGDGSNIPTSKTGAAVRKQAPALAKNLLAAMAGSGEGARYNGYTSCPFVTGYGRVMMAEFDYDLKLQETFPFDQSKPRRSMYIVKRHLLPRFYWNRMLKGKV